MGDDLAEEWKCRVHLLEKERPNGNEEENNKEGEEGQDTPEGEETRTNKVASRALEIMAAMNTAIEMRCAK